MKKNIFLWILQLSLMCWLMMLIIFFSSSSFIGKKSDKLRAICLRNGFNLSQKYVPTPPFFMYTILYNIRYIFLYNLEVKFCKGTYSWDQEVCNAKTFQLYYFVIFFFSMCDVKMFLTFISPNMVLLWQLFYLFCSCI